MPSLLSILVGSKPSVSVGTRNAVIPRWRVAGVGLGHHDADVWRRSRS